MRLFVGYRPNPPANYKADGLANAADEVQYEGAVFTDGTVVIRWRTKFKSTSVFNDYAEFFQVHGHEEYGTRIEWVKADPGKVVFWRQGDTIASPRFDPFANVGMTPDGDPF